MFLRIYSVFVALLIGLMTLLGELEATRTQSIHIALSFQ